MATETIDRYCPICGKAVADDTWDRFGEWCCSEAHAEEYVAEVRSQKQRQLVGAVPDRAERPARPRGGCC